MAPPLTPSPSKRRSNFSSPGSPALKQAKLSTFFQSPSRQTPAATPIAAGARTSSSAAAYHESIAFPLPESVISDGALSTSASGSESGELARRATGGHEQQQPLRNAARKVDRAMLDAAVKAIDLQCDIFTFDPIDVDTSVWPTRQRRPKQGTSDVKEGGEQPSAPYALLSHACVLLSATRSRLTIVTVLTNLLRVLMHHDNDALLPCIYLLSNHIAPPYDGVELGLGGAIVSRAIREVTGKSSEHLRRIWSKTGDPGDVAFEAKKDVATLLVGGAPRPIEITRLFATLHTIAGIRGTGSASVKQAHVTRLLVASQGEETRFLVRTLHSHLRINAVRTTITSALARAFVLQGGEIKVEDPKKEQWTLSVAERHGLLAVPTSAKQRIEPRRLHAMDKIQRAERLVREVRARHPNFGQIVPALLDHGLSCLAEQVPLRVGTPISPMLGSITRSLTAVFDKLGDRPFVCEFKYDGQRVQIHAQHVPEGRNSDTSSVALSLGGKGRWVGRRGDVYVRLFSRHLEDMTDKYPDIVDLVPMLMNVDHDTTALDVRQAWEHNTPRTDDDQRPSTTSFIMDAEVVAISLDGSLLPFQTLANRSRKDVELHDVKVAVGLFAFDLMQLNGRSLLKASLRKRRSLLFQHFAPCSPNDARIARFDYVKCLQSQDMDEVSDFFESARRSRCEGIMVKSLDHHWQSLEPAGTGHSGGDTDGADEGVLPLQHRIDLLADEVDNDVSQPDMDEESSSATVPSNLAVKGVNGRGKALLSTYEPDKRCESWLKVKKDYIEGLGDSLDLVPIGGWHGMGRKAAWWSPVLLAVYDASTDEYQAVCKCISGFTDAEYKSIKFERFVENSDTCYDARLDSCRHSYDTGGLVPDFWFTPCEVWEIRGADITLSPVYTASKGLVSPERGLSLRFPRFLRRRFDKAPELASSPRQLASMYLAQDEPSVAVKDDANALRDDDDEEVQAVDEESD